MKVMRILPLLAILLALVVAGCGGDDGGGNEAATTAEETTEQTTGETTGAEEGAPATTVDMTEYEFDPSDVTASKGDTINVANKGNVAHNLTIEQGPDPKEKTKKLAGTSTFLGGKSEKLTVDLDPGEYSMACTVPGHRELGMTGTFTVK